MCGVYCEKKCEREKCYSRYNGSGPIDLFTSSVALVIGVAIALILFLYIDLGFDLSRPENIWRGGLFFVLLALIRDNSLCHDTAKNMTA